MIGCDSKRNNLFHLLGQVFAAAVFICLVLFSLDMVESSQIIWAAGASTLASSAFLVFCLPNVAATKPRKLITGYVIAILCGEGMRLLANLVCRVVLTCQYGSHHRHVFEIAASFSVAMALLFMILFKFEHPPAAGLAIVMVLDIQNLPALAVILSAAIALALIRIVFRRVLHNLL